jgi:glycosyltransferase involved in cell wall biosynthesis|tara:strand:- start:2682 stop:4052 length:1371 start_codon:yes stop_codon:yes gene_type:complete
VKFLNLTKNTVYLEDIDLYIPFTESVQEIDTELVKKSKAFQLFVKIGSLDIIEANESRIEQNLKRLQNQVPQKEEKEESNMPESDQLQVKIKGHFEEAGGYAKVNRNLALGLDRLGVDVCIETSGSQSELNELELRQLAKYKKKPNRNAIHIDSVVPSFGGLSTGKYNILYTTIESYSAPKQFLEALYNYNEIWVVSEFCKEILERYGIKQKIYVVPDGINTDLYVNKGDKYEFRPSLNKFVFVSVFSWSYRKGYDVLLKSYLQEFTAEDNVSLLIVSRFQNSPSRNKVIKQEIDKYVKQCENPPHIARCSQIIPEFMMPNLYRACNAFVLLSRGEGFCLPYCESSLCGLPVIATNCSGQTMYLNDKNSYLVEPDVIRPMPEGLMHVHYWDNQEFPSLTSDEVIRQSGCAMRKVYENYSAAKQKNNKLKKFIAEHYNILTVAQIAKDRLDEIWSKL